jgi:6-phosphogluconate dehydrogenase (decarboxylating)
MVQNGIEYGLMAAYAEVLGVSRSGNVAKFKHELMSERRGCVTRSVAYTISIGAIAPKCGGEKPTIKTGCSRQ